MQPNDPKTGEEEVLLCPSAPPHPTEAVLIGVVTGSADEPRVMPTEHAMRVTSEIFQLALPVTPSEVFRFASTCRTSGCIHFQNAACQIAARGVASLDEVVARLPKCPIRAQCRWFHQEGPAMCRRCPQIVTEQHAPSAEMLRIVDETDPPPEAAATSESAWTTVPGRGPSASAAF